MTNKEFKYKPTKAFWKIHKLIEDGLPKFKDDEQKVFVIQGGQGAGKTIAILMLLIDYMEQTKSEITICSAQLSKLKDTALNDYIKIRQDFNLFDDKHFNKSESSYNYKAGHFTEFLGLDKADVGKGRRRRIVYINEVNKITLQQYTDITARADIVLMDFNPDARFFAHDLINEFNFISLTYLDNEYLSENEIRNILAYKSKGYDDEGNIINEYWANKWRIYGLGEIGGVEGRIFNWKPISYADYLRIDKTPIYTCDWGTVDPLAIGEMKYSDGKLYNHELNYMSENEWRQRLTATDLKQISGRNNDGFITWLFEGLNIPKNAVIVCDSNRPNKILSLRKAGWNYAIAVDGNSKAILDGIGLLQNLDVYYTSTSVNIANEQNEYCWATDRFAIQLEKPEDRNNHHMDRIRYGAKYYEKKGIIRKV